MISTAELLGRARVVDVGRGQNCAILLVVSQIAVALAVTNLVPLDTLGRVFAQVPSTEVSGAPSALVFPSRTVIFPIAQLGIFDAVQLVRGSHALEFILATIGSWERQHRLAELAFIFSISAVPDPIAHTAETM